MLQCLRPGSRRGPSSSVTVALRWWVKIPPRDLALARLPFKTRSLPSIAGIIYYNTVARQALACQCRVYDGHGMNYLYRPSLARFSLRSYRISCPLRTLHWEFDASLSSEGMSSSRKITHFYCSTSKERLQVHQGNEDDRGTIPVPRNTRPDPASPRQALVELPETSPRANAAPPSKRRRVDRENVSNNGHRDLKKLRTAPHPKRGSLPTIKSRSLRTSYVPAWKRLGLELKHSEQTSTPSIRIVPFLKVRTISTATSQEVSVDNDETEAAEKIGDKRQFEESDGFNLGLPPTPRSSPLQDESIVLREDNVDGDRPLQVSRKLKPRPRPSKTSRQSTQQGGPVASVEESKHSVRRLLEVRIVSKTTQSPKTLPVPVALPRKSVPAKQNRKPAPVVSDGNASDDEQFPTPEEEEPSVPGRNITRPRRTTKRVSYIEPVLVIDSESEPDRTGGLSADSDESDFEAPDDAVSVAESDDDVMSMAATDAESDAVQGSDEEEEQMVPIKKARPRSRTVNPNPVKAGLGINLKLPPLSRMEDIFADMASRALPLGLDKALKDLSGHSFRIGTMCSGTESPLLAVQGISQALEHMGMSGLNFKHEFSAEIDVVKQSYIERNFRPKILFRDVREFIPNDAESATTAYGAKVLIPTVDMLIAGFVCKDLSHLNNHQKSLDEEGESGDTFAAIYSYAKNFRPGVILLENVTGTSALWDDLKLKWADVGYECQWLYCDTKNYYLPQTRKRMYMIAIEKSVFGHGCSSPFEAFLMEDHSEQYSHIARTVETDWELCRLRYDRTRSDEQLGIKRPISQWSEIGTVRPPDFANRKWYYSQSSRVWDAIDIAHLQAARSDHDSLHKMIAWDVSQNPDRFRSPIGIVACITPKGCVFVTNRQTALNGSQLLRLQGIRNDKLLLGRESQADLQDLAGNAMSSTVIGTSIISAIIAGRQALQMNTSSEEDVTATPKSSKVRLVDIGSATTQELSSKKLERVDVPRLLEDAKHSSRLCACEGHKHVSSSVIHTCQDCKHTACSNCAGNPRHNYTDTVSTESRVMPSEFEKAWRHQLPSRLRFTQVPDLRKLVTGDNSKAWNAMLDRVEEADLCSQWFTMSSFRRDDQEWIVSHVASLATLQLRLREPAEWRLYVECPETEPGDSIIRQRLQLPLARGQVAGDLLEPQWEILLPSKEACTVSITGSKSRIASWRSRMGLPDYKTETMPLTLDIQSDYGTPALREIYGRYTLLPNCGSAMSSLYRKSDQGKPPLYLFLESNPIGPCDKDHFVFSHDFLPLPYGQSRVATAHLDSSWRPWSMANQVNVEMTVAGTWTTAPMTMETDVDSTMQVKVPSTTAMANYAAFDCSQAVSILDVKIRESTRALTFLSYSWALERARLLPAFSRWNEIEATCRHSVCSCSPVLPRVLWSVDTAGNATAREDQKSAATFERAIKTRRPVLEVHSSAVTSGTQVQISMNIATLIHRAKARLAKFEHCNTAWSLDTNYMEKAWEPFERFHLRSNANDQPYSGPLQLKHDLADAQKRSLAWMRSQERGEIMHVVEIEEETNIELGWRAQARAQAQIVLRGGVLADLPSFGKTVTTIGLIQSEFEQSGPEAIIKSNATSCKQSSNLIEVAATLIVCPHHITKQWREELKTFLGDEQYEEYNVLLIKNYQQLEKLSIADMCKARVIIVPWQVFAEGQYISALASFAAMPEPTSTQGRASDAWLNYVDEQMPNRVETLKMTDATSFVVDAKKTIEKRLEHPDFKAVVPLKIKHGASYEPYSSMSLSIGQTSIPGTAYSYSTVRKAEKSNGNSDWSSHLRPMLQMFRFNRVVVDEYHYLLEKGAKDSRKNQTAYAIIKKLHGHKKWILSGTPALANVSDINQIASLLGGSLGRDIFETKSQATELEKRSMADQTDVERFLSNVETMTYEWHEGRHYRAQEFLDLFVRQNAPVLDHISCTERLQPIELSDAHRCIYLEQSQHLIAQRMQIKKLRSSHADRYERLNASLNNSDTAEEALLKSALCFKPEGKVAGLDGLLRTRQSQIKGTENDIRNCMMEAEEYQKHSNDPDNHYSGFKRDVKRANVLGDEDTCQRMRRLIAKVEREDIPSRNTAKPTRLKCATQLKALTSTITTYAQELTLRQRSLRFIEAVQEILPTISKPGDVQSLRCSSPDCSQTASDISQLFLISHCGHLVCEPCLAARGDNEACVHDGCSAPALPSNMINVRDLGSTKDESAGASHGEKLAALCHLLHAVPDDDQAIVFVANEDDIDNVSEAFEEHDISFDTVSKSRKDAADVIEDFQKNQDPEESKKVLILNLGDESAAGVNLVNANHVIFVSPLLAQDQYTYDSSMAQAIARCRRYRQEKKVHIYHFAALRTIDVDILEHRHKRTDGISGYEMPKNLSSRGAKKEKTKMVCDSDGNVSLIPRSWLADTNICDRLRIDPNAQESFTSLINFSENFKDDDE
ncbi:hypothetical protein K491DRAFT_771566 [Lophiostoma macrostomum CBS 122681]|uniref:Helicase C-terminal domain-containing protein n=1 Tax=Lophiostoma macrostomum CBS 122681 TaxID=1314788 RepID=A0A6A6SNF4_9PLEO|nr:hypothetical protein K491DRAFT_771566 [Lophiostoma macrostomum CBS 122681]